MTKVPTINIVTDNNKIKSFTIEEQKNNFQTIIENFQLNPGYNLLNNRDLVKLNDILLKYKDKDRNIYPNPNTNSSMKKEIVDECIKILKKNAKRYAKYGPDQIRFSITANHNIKQLNSLNTELSFYYKAITYTLLFGLILGFVGAGIATGEISIPSEWSWTGWAGTGIGAASLGTYTSLHILKNYSQLCKKYLEEIHKVNKKQLLFSNVNDLLTAFYFLALGLSLCHVHCFLTSALSQSILAFPAGGLTVLSGGHQFLESLTAFKNACKTNNKEEMIKALLNMFYSISVAIFGVCTIFEFKGKFNLLGALSNWGLGFASLIVAGMKFRYTNQFLNKIKETEKLTVENITNYLQENLSIVGQERENLKETITAMSKENIQEWYKKHKKVLNYEQQELFTQYLDKKEIQNQKNKLEEIQKLILNEEIAKEEQKKIDTFASIVDKETLEEALNLVQNIKKGKDCTKNSLENIFSKIKEKAQKQYRIELGKMTLYSLFMAVPGVFSLKWISEKIYSFAMTILTSTNLGINLTPKFRNVTPEIEKQDLGINILIEEAEKAKKFACNLLHSKRKKRNFNNLIIQH